MSSAENFTQECTSVFTLLLTTFLLFVHIYKKKNARSVANDVDRDRTPRSVVSDLTCTVCSGLVGLNT